MKKCVVFVIANVKPTFSETEAEQFARGLYRGIVGGGRDGAGGGLAKVQQDLEDLEKQVWNFVHRGLDG